MGHFEKSRYVLDYRKVRTYVVPEGLADFKVRIHELRISKVNPTLNYNDEQLTPFVTRRMEPTKSSFTNTTEDAEGRIQSSQRALNGEDFIEKWAAENPDEVEKLEKLRP